MKYVENSSQGYLKFCWESPRTLEVFQLSLKKTSSFPVKLEVYFTFSRKTSQIHEGFRDIRRTCCFRIITGAKSRVSRKNYVKSQELQENYVERGVFLSKVVKHEVC